MSVAQWLVATFGLSAADARADDIGAQRYSDRPASFKGWIDEVRVESVVRSAQWIRFCYENQQRSSPIILLN